MGLQITQRGEYDYPGQEYKGGAVQRIPLGSMRCDADAAEISSRILGDGYEKDAVRRYILECSAPFLSDCAEILDSPGSNSVEKGHSEIAAGIADEADIAIYILNATQPLGKTDIEGLEACADASYLFIILNKVDMIDEDEQTVDQILSEVRGHIEDKTELENYFLYPVSGKCRLDGSDKKIGLQHAFSPFMEKLSFFIKSEGANLLKAKKERIVTEQLGEPEELLAELKSRKEEARTERKNEKQAVKKKIKKKKANKKKKRVSLFHLILTVFVGALLLAFIIVGTTKLFDRSAATSWMGPSGPSVISDRLGIIKPLKSKPNRESTGSVYHSFNKLVAGQMDTDTFFRKHAVLLFAVLPLLIFIFSLARKAQQYLKFPIRTSTVLGWGIFLYTAAFLYFFVFMPGIRPLPDFFLRGGGNFYCFALDQGCGNEAF